MSEYMSYAAIGINSALSSDLWRDIGLSVGRGGFRITSNPHSPGPRA